MEDSQIIELFLERSHNAIEQLSHKYGKLCHHIAYTILNNYQDAEECENDAYLNTWFSIPPEKPKNLKAYVCKITRNLALNKLKYNTCGKRDSRFDILFSELKECVPSAEDVEAASDDTVTDAIYRFLLTLDSVTRALFVRRYFEMESVDKIAKTYGLNPSSVSSKLLRTRSKLKNFLEGEGIYI